MAWNPPNRFDIEEKGGAGVQEQEEKSVTTAAMLRLTEMFVVLRMEQNRMWRIGSRRDLC
jgi:hypothetical protein